MRSAGLELTKLTYTRLEDNLIRHRGDRLRTYVRPTFYCRATIYLYIYIKTCVCNPVYSFRLLVYPFLFGTSRSSQLQIFRVVHGPYKFAFIQFCSLNHPYISKCFSFTLLYIMSTTP